jgi:hypothetical protein
LAILTQEKGEGGKAMFVYALGPVDVWFGWTPLADVLVIASKPFDQRIDQCHLEVGVLLRALVKAQRLAALHLCWDSVLREREGGPWFIPLPGASNDPEVFLLAWKMHNNGTTFVAAPHRLPWLDASAEGVAHEQ